MARRQGPQLPSLMYDKACAADDLMRPEAADPIKARSANRSINRPDRFVHPMPSTPAESSCAGPMRLHLFRPAAAGRYPGILLYSEIYQITGPIRRMAAFLAGQGYLARTSRFIAARKARCPPRQMHMTRAARRSIRAWLGRHPRFVFHFTPTSASGLNAVEGFFAKLTRRRLKRGAFRSITDLQAAINRFLRDTNDQPKPFVWTANPDKIIAAVRRGYQALDPIH